MKIMSLIVLVIIIIAERNMQCDGRLDLYKTQPEQLVKKNRNFTT